MEPVKVPIAELVLDENNARRSDVKAQADSLREFGQHRPVVAQRGSNKIIAGNHLVLAARSLGWPEVWVLFVDDDDATALRRSLADNLVADRGSWDSQQLRGLLDSLEQPDSLPGIDDATLRRMMHEVTKAETDDSGPVYPIVARPNERYDYVLVYSTNEIDGLWLSDTLGAGEMRSYKSPKRRPARSRVITVEQFKAALNEAIRRGQPIP